MEKVAQPQKAPTITDDAEMIIETSEDLEVVKTFDEMGLREELVRGKLITNLLKPTTYLPLTSVYSNYLL